MRTDINRIFLDLDGVLADFVGAAVRELGIDIPSERPLHYAMEKWMVPHITTKQFWQTVEQQGEDFWVNLELYPWAHDLVSLASIYGEVFFLTSPSRNPYCVSGKVRWIQKHFRKYSRNIILTPHKYLLAGEHRILIDDSSHKLDPFVEHGGKGILFPRAWNSNYEWENRAYEYTQVQLEKAVLSL